ncbi:hypothetical protein GCM10022403_024450 [Streptomyces coacervatus]|uniref:Uncharacterized protein n=1 Tax=Streptomyces coacervatus TaxID=647381 RepID=A0ABP7H9T7_9ACTN
MTGPRPDPEALRELNMPVLLLLAGSSRTHDTYEVAAKASALVSRAQVDVVPELGRRLTELLSP